MTRPQIPHRLDKGFYNRFFGRFDRPMPVEKHSHYKLYTETLKFLRFGERFVDLGCGDGAFIGLAKAMGMSPVAGIDFSDQAINLAVARGVEGVNFINMDLMDVEYRGIDCDTFTILETLEHLPNDGDRMLLFMLRETGKRLVYTVPSYDSISHARYFTDMGQVEDRYNPDRCTEYTLATGIRFYICEEDGKV